ncbi:DUF3365 domain-containing protein [Sedimenticola selenatireducens]|uniref:Tll0287-like domain-containing protein n=1 Tax=Sedimenticola selenatireducens TaxID=191960 RepID=UPI002AAB1235|nr:DUF3365 domain-containing protein [Sedimenticola selenatireducens]
MTISLWCNGRRKLTVVMLLTVCAYSTITSADSNTVSVEAPDIAAVKASAKHYVGSLKALLQKKMSADGPIGALDVCGVEGARIGGEITRNTGWSVRRITNRARNPLAMPDEYESKMLDQFNAKIAEQPDTTSLVKYEVVEENGATYARFMKGIRVEPVCLTCHGDKATMGEVGDKIDSLYPHDKARDYKIGDLRGALSIKIKLE